MSGIQCLQQIECFRAAYFAEDDAVRTKPQRLPQQIADRDRRHIRLGTPRFEPHQIRRRQVDFRRIIDDHDPVRRRDECAERIQQRGLSGTRPTADQDRAPCFDGGA